MTEKHTIERTYYHDFGFSAQEPAYESMVAYLLDERVLFLGLYTEDNSVKLYISINDHFPPDARVELLPAPDIAKLFDMYRKDGYNGVAQYVADKRGIPNKRWRDE